MEDNCERLGIPLEDILDKLNYLRLELFDDKKLLQDLFDLQRELKIVSRHDDIIKAPKKKRLPLLKVIGSLPMALLSPLQYTIFAVPEVLPEAITEIVPEEMMPELELFPKP